MGRMTFAQPRGVGSASSRGECDLGLKMDLEKLNPMCHSNTGGEQALHSREGIQNYENARGFQKNARDH